MMLILNRKRNEMLMIGDCVGVAVLAVRGRQVKLGITAPKDVPILREELCIEIRQEAEMMKISQ